MKYVIYRSLASRPLEANIDIVEILRAAINRNPGIGITGFLHYEHSRFYQYFEGSKESCDHLWRLLNFDRRHYDLELIDEGVRKERMFSDWDMGFSRANKQFISPTNEDQCVIPSPTTVHAFFAGIRPRGAGI